ncbi:carbamate kinase [Methanothrix soehngenii]|uniref:carbamate kinase n=1 Tax=Methanothrix soehngenii TaxID=2223 RepID=UPI0023F2D1BB|nr:carbamate kinase [Methanothrix soehngenii]MCK9585535.1 carbamate kinase [Methanothrix soehngenii]MDD5255938.1 carbamate kinase [Methanothrix soehngenii]
MNLAGPTVLAFGGNALLLDPRNPATQERTAVEFARAVRLLMNQGEGMVLVHGNGPQVGMILLRIEATKDCIPPETLDIMVAETQGSIGYLLCRSMRNEIPEREIAAVLTQVLVDPDDPGFATPSKPVGPYYTQEGAEGLVKSQGWRMLETAGKGWRRVVPSPRPQEIIELHTIMDAVGHGHLIIAGGGGGIPVIRDECGGLHGIEAVIDKDLTACKLAAALGAERFVILTDVPHVSTGFGSTSERRIGRMKASRARRLLAQGEFPPGSMGPKVEAAAIFAERTGLSALITNIELLERALGGKAGTWIDP